MAHIEPAGLPAMFGSMQNGRAQILYETRTVAWIVIVAWIVVWTGLGAWRMAKRDA